MSGLDRFSDYAEFVFDELHCISSFRFVPSRKGWTNYQSVIIFIHRNVLYDSQTTEKVTASKE